MANEVEVFDISPKDIEVIETQYSVDGTPTCIHTRCYYDNEKYLSINLCTFGLHNKPPIMETKVTFNIEGAKQLRDMLVTAIDGLEKQEYIKKKRKK